MKEKDNKPVSLTEVGRSRLDTATPTHDIILQECTIFSTALDAKYFQTVLIYSNDICQMTKLIK